MQTVEEFFQKHGIAIGQYSRVKLNEADDFAVEILKMLVDLHCSGVSGAKELVASIVAPDSTNTDSERRFANCLTEGLGIWFAHKKLGASIQVIEGCPPFVLSPFRRKQDDPLKQEPSCDFSAIWNGVLHYFEVKDCSKDLLVSHASTTGLFTPASGQEKRKWIEDRIKDALSKGANYLIARLPTWIPAKLSEEIAIKENLFIPYHDISPNEAEIEVTFSVPDWFKGIYLVKCGTHVFVSVIKSTTPVTSSPNQSACLPTPPAPP